MADVQQKEKRILIIEDDHVYRSVLMSTLRKAGFNCSFCIDGNQAIKILSKERFDLLISDYLLPGTNGVAIIRSAREHGIETPALLITNYPSELLQISNKGLGRTKIMDKVSFPPNDMPRIVQEMLKV
jgi:two-component system, OmpR family, phosphate regulon response regulator OmpR